MFDDLIRNMGIDERKVITGRLSEAEARETEIRGEQRKQDKCGLTFREVCDASDPDNDLDPTV